VDRSKGGLRDQALVYFGQSSLIDCRDSFLAPSPPTGQEILSDCSDIVLERCEVLEIVALQQRLIVLCQDLPLCIGVELDEAASLGLTELPVGHSLHLMQAVSA